MKIGHLISTNGIPFVESIISDVSHKLDSLSDCERETYRNNNAMAIAQLDTKKTLIVSGPGTGKSYLFMERINKWYQNNSEAKVLVTSFVRKLVNDLQNEISNTLQLTSSQKSNITVSTIHKYARSLVEKNHGTKHIKFKPHFRIIGETWKQVIWADVIAFEPKIRNTQFKWIDFETQLHNANFNSSGNWKSLKAHYFTLSRFYNAAGFADIILHATDALDEDNALDNNTHFIIDEFQDFNLAEEKLINRIVGQDKDVLVVGDDDQVLYDTLKSSTPAILRNLYNNTLYAKGMLPFCSRCSYHITKCAEHFIHQNMDANCIRKIYLPIKKSCSEAKPQIIACATPATAVDYISNFIDSHNNEIIDRMNKLESGEVKDAFLLILSPSKSLTFLGNGRDTLLASAAKYQSKSRRLPEDYSRLLTYYSLAKTPSNNFILRKALYYENTSTERVHELIIEAIRINSGLFKLTAIEVQNVIKKSNAIHSIIHSDTSIKEKVNLVAQHINFSDKYALEKYLLEISQDKNNNYSLLHKEEEEAELDEIGQQNINAVEILTIVGSKGLSADNVIIIGFDDVNMKHISRNAFFVAITRARRQLHLITSMKSKGAKSLHAYFELLPDNHIELYKYRKSDRSKSEIRTKMEFKEYLNTLNSYH